MDREGEGHYGLEAETLEHGEVDGKGVAAAVDAGCDELERQRGHDELAVLGEGGDIVDRCGGDRDGDGGREDRGHGSRGGGVGEEERKAIVVVVSAVEAGGWRLS